MVYINAYGASVLTETKQTQSHEERKNTHTHTHTHTGTHTHTHIYIYARTHAYTHVNTHTHGTRAEAFSQRGRLLIIYYILRTDSNVQQKKGEKKTDNGGGEQDDTSRGRAPNMDRLLIWTTSCSDKLTALERSKQFHSLYYPLWISCTCQNSCRNTNLKTVRLFRFFSLLAAFTLNLPPKTDSFLSTAKAFITQKWLYMTAKTVFVTF